MALDSTFSFDAKVFYPTVRSKEKVECNSDENLNKKISSGLKMDCILEDELTSASRLNFWKYSNSQYVEWCSVERTKQLILFHTPIRFLSICSQNMRNDMCYRFLITKKIFLGRVFFLASFHFRLLQWNFVKIYVWRIKINS